MTLDDGLQVVKSRDDHAPVLIERRLDAADPQKPFQLRTGATCSWAKSDEPFGPEKLRPRIEPWLTALVQSEHLSLLVGSGLTHAVYHIAKAETLPGMATAQFGVRDEEIAGEAKRSAAAA